MPKRKTTSQERKRGAALGRALKAEREAKNRSQDQLARGADVSVDNLRRIEQGRVANPGVFTVAAIAEALDRPLAYFVRQRRGRRS